MIFKPRYDLLKRWSTVYTIAEIKAMITAGYRPISTPADLDAIRSETARAWASGTQFQTASLAGGLDKNYVMVNDIDMYAATREGGAYWNSGNGWNAGGVVFLGNFDGAGFLIHGLFSKTNGLFHNIGNSSSSNEFIRNLYLCNFDIEKGSEVGGLCRTSYLKIHSVLVSGMVYGTSPSSLANVGGLIGDAQGGTEINSCVAAVSVMSKGSRVGGMVGHMRVDSSVNESIVTGNVVAVNGVGAVIGINQATVTKTYYNSETSGAAGAGTAKTTEQLKALTASDLNADYWEFQSDKYPILKAFKGAAAFNPPPTNLQSTIDAGDVNLTWDTAPMKHGLKGYNVYASQDNGAWTKLNGTMLTARSYDHVSPEAGVWLYFVKAVYEFRGFDDETGNSITTTQTIE